MLFYREPVGYYKQFQNIFDTFKKYAGPEIEKLPLRMGEDVCQAWRPVPVLGEKNGSRTTP